MQTVVKECNRFQRKHRLLCPVVLPLHSICFAMKNLAVIIISILTILTSCKEDHQDQENLAKTFAQSTYPQKWILVSMTGNIANIPPAKGKDMDYQEFYIFNADSTFSKTRDRDGASQTVHGTYSIRNSAPSNYIVLHHETDNDLIGNCAATLDEQLVFSGANELNSTWQACDGPGLVVQ